MRAREASKIKVTGNYVFVHTIETFFPTESGRNFKKKPESVEVKAITAENYNNICSWCNFFNGFNDVGGSIRVYATYTEAGYIPYKITRVAPFRGKKVVDHFQVFHFPYRFKLGFRENEVLDNLTSLEIEQNDGSHLVICFKAEIDGETKTFDYDYISGKVTG